MTDDDPPGLRTLRAFAASEIMAIDPADAASVVVIVNTMVSQLANREAFIDRMRERDNQARRDVAYAKTEVAAASNVRINADLHVKEVRTAMVAMHNALLMAEVLIRAPEAIQNLSEGDLEKHRALVLAEIRRTLAMATP